MREKPGTRVSRAVGLVGKRFVVFVLDMLDAMAMGF